MLPFTNWKNSKKYPVYDDKSDTRRKVVKVRGTLKWNYVQNNFCQISVYVIL